MGKKRRIGIFGWGVVAPKSPTVEAFEKNLERPTGWLEPFDGFGPSNFLVGRPEFDFHDYKSWIDERFEPRRFAQIDGKMGNTVKYAIGAFIQALGQNQGLESFLSEVGSRAHVYIGTGLGEYPLEYDIALEYFRAQKRWNHFWCSDEHHGRLRAYRAGTHDDKARVRAETCAPADPGFLDPGTEEYDEARTEWEAFWVHSSEGLRRYLDELRELEAEGIDGDIDASKGHVLRRKMSGRKALNRKYGCPDEPWNSVDPNLLWNIPNIPAAQISMLGKIRGASMAPVAACSGFGTGLRLAVNAIQMDQADVVVIGNTDPQPHPLSVGTFFGARVLSHDAQVSKPFTGLRGTHVAGGACVWIVGDADLLRSKGMKPLGLEVLGVALTSDADHIITPSMEGPRAAIMNALGEAGVEPKEVATWDMHATATPGDWTELQNTLSVFPEGTCFTARKGTFGHGMSVCGGWELTAQHLGFAKGKLMPVDLEETEVHAQISPYFHCLATGEATPLEGDVAGKINMGVGGVNACVVCRRWPEDVG